MGKCKFASKWLEDMEFEPWLRPVSGNNREAYCCVCRKAISVASMGIKAVRSHMLSASHKAAMGRKQQVSIAHFCTTSPPPPTIAEATTASATSSKVTADLRVMLAAPPSDAGRHSNAAGRGSVVPQHRNETPIHKFQ
ncbi:hypothetical protein CgunFtcFv8_010760 [Champsocephalus gunnari]|uniref:Uncharacterized protein n=1 Tax=Champsocephalus gunnari TaxID=52237 RepID=A0AAN8DUX0_CHAGU|nr:hypothetical protein CgunFtcFv8_010760 [Champsocephalus gunnari]